MEEDLRQIVVTHLVSQLPQNGNLNETLQSKWLDRFKRDSDAMGNPTSLEVLIAYSDFQDQIDILYSNRNLLPSRVLKKRPS